MSSECRPVYILGVDPDLVIPGPQIQFGEVDSPMQFVQHVINRRDWKPVLDSDCI